MKDIPLFGRDFGIQMKNMPIFGIEFGERLYKYLVM
jgi:hypothetical protein